MFASATRNFPLEFDLVKFFPLGFKKNPHIGKWSLVIHSSVPTQAIASLMFDQTKSSVLPARCVGSPIIKQVRLCSSAHFSI